MKPSRGSGGTIWLRPGRQLSEEETARVSTARTMPAGRSADVTREEQEGHGTCRADHDCHEANLTKTLRALCQRLGHVRSLRESTPVGCRGSIPVGINQFLDCNLLMLSGRKLVALVG